MPSAILEIRGLKKYFPIEAGLLSKQVGAVHAVDGVSFDVRKGESLGLVGESGCGKTTIGLTVLRLYEPTSGKAYFEDRDIFQMKAEAIRRMRRGMTMIFQDPFASLNPRMTVFEIVGEPFDIHGRVTRKEKEEKVMKIIEKVGLTPSHIYRYPHEFSGGQRQRIGIARALAVEPKLIIADEPVSALDISVRAQILNLLEELRKELDLTYVYISHDLSTVRHTCDRIAVMYLGKIVELTDTETLFREQLHPYSKALLSAIPVPNPSLRRNRIILRGDVPTPIKPPSGCRFHPRCPMAQRHCHEVEPEFVNLGTPENEHFVACHEASGEL